ncbi:MAG: M3 family metallopeptidase [Methylococcales bacterium]|nr:M3 family metallopeptidase [Methylococcales bacterium]
MDNPLLDPATLPRFSAIKPEHAEPAIDRLILDARNTVKQTLAAENFDYATLVTPIALAEQKLHQAWSIIGHLHAVSNSPDWRDAYGACLPKLTEYHTEIGQNQALFHAYQQLKNSVSFAELDQAQQKVISNALRDFRLSGVDLPPKQQQRYKAIAQQLAELSHRYEQNLLDATQAWDKTFTDATALAGLPEAELNQAQQSAVEAGQSGYRITLQFPSYIAVMTYADDRALREEVYYAFNTRASEQGPHAGKWDNSEVMEEILSLRHELAQLLEFSDYAELSLATKMAESVAKVGEFLEDLGARSRPQAQRELSELAEFGRELGIATLQPWDVAYLSEKLKQQRFGLSQEELKPYFPVDRVEAGLFKLVQRLFDVRIEPVTEVDTWHPAVRCYRIVDAKGQERGLFYTDWYARRDKRGGAWMDGLVDRHVRDGQLHSPIAFLTGNFTPPEGDQPVLLTHDEVTTLFHEFGHGLQHLLTQVDEPGVAGINGVAWDAVELPSQFMENWCWERESLDMIAGHYQTGAKLPDALFDKLLASKHFQSAMAMVRQLEFALFDLYLHRDFDPDQGGRIRQTLERARQQVAVIMPPDWNRFAHGFAHIFAGGYAAGYYSYKWAEVLSSDAFALFEEHGLFDRDTGQRFLATVLESGGSEDALAVFKAFRGREPELTALLRHSGIAA